MHTTNPTPPTDLITRGRVAEMLSVHVSTIKRMHRKKNGRGKLTPYLLGPTLVRYSLAEVQAVIEAAAKVPKK